MIHTDGRPTIVSDSRENREFAAPDDRKTVEAAESITAQAVEVPPHLRGSISPEEWTQICKEDAEAEESDDASVNCPICDAPDNEEAAPRIELETNRAIFYVCDCCQHGWSARK